MFEKISKNKAKHLEIGEVGEKVAEKYLKNNNFKILGRNYSKKLGEIDIIAKKQDILHFIEVKTVSRETSNGFEPEININWHKRRCLSRIIDIYLEENSVSRETDWQVDSVAVFLNMKTRRAKIRITEDIEL